MADGYLETRLQDYEVRKAKWLRKKGHLPQRQKPLVAKPEDEAL